MDVIGNNIANVNTYGFKSSRASFSDVYYQTLSAGSAPMTATGGTNPTQIGYGATVATIDVLNSQSGPGSTDRAMDVYIAGDGLLAVKDSDGNLMYTRLGILGFDAKGNLVDGNGNFVQGYSAISMDGTINPDDLGKITAPPEMLDQLTNISIGPNGEIIGTMPGDVETEQNIKRPPWLVSATPTGENAQNVQGDIKVTMEYLSTMAQGSTLPDWIVPESLKLLPNSMLNGEYTISYDEARRQIQFIQGEGADAEVLFTGAYRQGSEVELVNAKGEKAASLTTHGYTVPADGSETDISFTMNQTVTVNYTDAGGTLHTESAIYDGTPQLTVGDILLQIDPDAVDKTDVKSLSRDDSAAIDWLDSLMLSETSSIPEDTKLVLQAGVTKTVTPSYSRNDHLNWMDEDAVASLVKQLNVPGTCEISVEKVTGGYEFTVTASDGTTTCTSNVVAGAGDPVKFTFDEGTAAEVVISLGEMSAENFIDNANGITDSFYTSSGLDADAISKALATKGAEGEFSISYATDGKVTFTYPDGGKVVTGALADGDDIVIDGVTIGKFTDAFKTAVGAADAAKVLGSYGTYSLKTGGEAFASLSEKNTLRLVDGNTNATITEVTYRSGSRVTLGDLTLQVDEKAIGDMFDARGDIDASNLALGEVALTEKEDWLYDANVASAQPGIGEAITIGNIAIAKVPNMMAMEQAGDSYFVTSANSGEAVYTKPGTNETGTLDAGYLEMSNVDVSKEFTEMITTQRGFQANTRIITVSDQMLEELVNLKR
jgi:flagellar hook-basal body protein